MFGQKKHLVTKFVCQFFFSLSKQTSGQERLLSKKMLVEKHFWLNKICNQTFFSRKQSFSRKCLVEENDLVEKVQKTFCQKKIWSESFGWGGPTNNIVYTNSKLG